MNKAQVNLQDLFLNQVRKDHIPVTVYLVGGVQLKGLVRGFDAFTIMLDSPGKATQIVYKHAIASIVPGRQVEFQIQEPQREQSPREQSSEEKNAGTES
ncbi:MAG: RNA chaperone Hfq [Armatimonadota bacterium]